MQKIAVVTGGSRGIGFGIASQLAEDGFHVVIMAVSPREKHKEHLLLLENYPSGYTYIQGSIASREDRIRCISQVIREYGRIDVLVNNAGIAPQKRTDLLDMTEESFDELIQTNTKGTMFLSQLAAKQMLCQEAVNGIRGIIINISSMSAVVSSVNRGEYCVSKAGISMLTRLYADRLAGEQIYVYEVRPAIIATDMTSVVREKYDSLFKQGICPIARWGNPEDIGNAVSILCSGKLKYSTGQVIDVDGGFHIQRL